MSLSTPEHGLSYGDGSSHDQSLPWTPDTSESLDVLTFDESDKPPVKHAGALIDTHGQLAILRRPSASSLSSPSLQQQQQQQQQQKSKARPLLKPNRLFDAAVAPKPVPRSESFESSTPPVIRSTPNTLSAGSPMSPLAARSKLKMLTSSPNQATGRTPFFHSPQPKTIREDVDEQEESFDSDCFNVVPLAHALPPTTPGRHHRSSQESDDDGNPDDKSREFEWDTNEFHKWCSPPKPMRTMAEEGWTPATPGNNTNKHPLSISLQSGLSNATQASPSNAVPFLFSPSPEQSRSGVSIQCTSAHNSELKTLCRIQPCDHALCLTCCGHLLLQPQQDRVCPICNKTVKGFRLERRHAHSLDAAAAGDAEKVNNHHDASFVFRSQAGGLSAMFDASLSNTFGKGRSRDAKLEEGKESMPEGSDALTEAGAADAHAPQTTLNYTIAAEQGRSLPNHHPASLFSLSDMLRSNSTKPAGPVLSGSFDSSPATQSAASSVVPAFNMNPEIQTIRIDNLPHQVPTSALTAFLLEGLPPLPFSYYAPTCQPVRILYDRSSHARNITFAFVECSDYGAAKVMASYKDGLPFVWEGKTRHLSVGLATQGELSAVIFPTYKHGFRGNLPIVRDGDSRAPLLMAEEVLSLLRLCNLSIPHHGPRPAFERPFMALASIIEKYPWAMDKSPAKYLVDAMHAAVAYLTENKHRISEWRLIAETIVRTVLLCPAATWAQKESVLLASGLGTPAATASPPSKPAAAAATTTTQGGLSAKAPAFAPRAAKQPVHSSPSPSIGSGDEKEKDCAQSPSGRRGSPSRRRHRGGRNRRNRNRANSASTTATDDTSVSGGSIASLGVSMTSSTNSQGNN